MVYTCVFDTQDSPDIIKWTTILVDQFLRSQYYPMDVGDWSLVQLFQMLWKYKLAYL